jgi:defect in organelle trafficking protein DotD
MIELNKLIGTSLLAIALNGCATNKAADVDPAMERLTDIAESILMHDKRLADIRAAQYVEEKGQLPAVSDTSMFPELNQHVSLGVDWHGPLDALVKRLASFCGYETRFLGDKPAGDVLVSVNTDYRRIIDILYDAGVKSGVRAHLTVKASDRVFEVRYVNL